MVVSRLSQKQNGVILIVDDEAMNVKTISDLLVKEGYEVRGATDSSTAFLIIENVKPDLILLDIKLPGMNGFEICDKLKASEKFRDIPVIFLSAMDTVEDKVEGFKLGGADFITKPFQAEEVLVRVDTQLKVYRMKAELEAAVSERTLELEDSNKQLLVLKNELEKENIALRDNLREISGKKEIVGKSETLLKCLDEAENVAKENTTVLILGETGTGKELLAQVIHDMSPRSNRRMIKVNCASLPANLIESELFGREKGAYTGAMSKQMGRFEIADGSTIFLDEIGDLPLELQSKLLRVLQEGTFEKLGSTKPIKVDVRVIAATNHDIKELVIKGSFRKDLYYRINVFPIVVPPLIERRDDIPLLVWSFINEFNTSMGKAVTVVNEKDMKYFTCATWKGNVRELRNVVERSMIMTSGRELNLKRATQLDLIDEEIQRDQLDVTLEELERHYITRTLDRTAWRVRGEGGAAEKLGLKATTLEARMKKLGISRP